MPKTINLSAFKDFVNSGTFGGILLLIFVAISLLIANTGYHTAFAEMLENSSFSVGDIVVDFPVASFINDGLMAIFSCW